VADASYGVNEHEQIISALHNMVHMHRKNESAILKRLEQMECKIMQAIEQYAVKVNSSFDAIGDSIDDLTNSMAGVQGDVTELKRMITELQTNPGTLTPADQALLDALEARATELVSKTSAVSAALVALDAQTDNVPTP